ncbi:methylated-DNA--protein-cysteine methyltransferase isoform X2 [Lagopus muta]|uniref:methylated-DNA--protein-cysteine methyltransferase isoform X2 n=1 Tax=Lagopus muta TaxID=64668 RepID=UPI00209E873F|nr:methylated-DNA--protein-cysteine methyltransferase isoform X2 [Lagopus muta]
MANWAAQQISCSAPSSPQQPQLSTLLSAPVGLWGMFTKRPRPALGAAERGGDQRPRGSGPQGRHHSFTMAARRVPKVTSKEGASQCQEKHVVLLSPVGKLEMSGCETGVHEIKLPKLSVLPNGTEAPMRCELCGTATSMPEPLQQCAAWLSAYFCEPSRTQQLPLPPFHHPMLQRALIPAITTCGCSLLQCRAVTLGDTSSICSASVIRTDAWLFSFFLVGALVRRYCFFCGSVI